MISSTQKPKKKKCVSLLHLFSFQHQRYRFHLFFGVHQQPTRASPCSKLQNDRLDSAIILVPCAVYAKQWLLRKFKKYRRGDPYPGHPQRTVTLQTGFLTCTLKSPLSFNNNNSTKTPSFSFVSITMSSLLLDNAIAAVQDGLSQYAAAKKYGVPQSTISDHIRSTPTLRKVKIPQQRLSPTQESFLYD